MGRITAAYGVKGWVRVYSYTDPMEGIFEYSPWSVSRGGRRQTIEVEEGKRQGKGLVARPVGFSDRNHAEQLAGWEIRVDKARLPTLDEGEFYWHQLEGLAVINTQGERFGRIDYLFETGSNDVMVVAADEGSIDERERMIPYVDEQVVMAVDLDAGMVTVDWDRDY